MIPVLTSPSSPKCVKCMQGIIHDHRAFVCVHFSSVYWVVLLYMEIFCLIKCWLVNIYWISRMDFCNINVYFERLLSVSVYLCTHYLDFISQFGINNNSSASLRCRPSPVIAADQEVPHWKMKQAVNRISCSQMCMRNLRVLLCWMPRRRWRGGYTLWNVSLKPGYSWTQNEITLVSNWKNVGL